MGDSTNTYYDDLDDYKNFCEVLGVEIKMDDFYKHERQLLEELGFASKYDYYVSLRRSEVRNRKIDSILNPESVEKKNKRIIKII